MEKSENSTIPENDIPPHVWAILHEFLLGISNPKLDLQKPHLKPSLVKVYPLIIFMYAVLLAVGLVANLAVFIHICRHKLYRDGTYSFILNNVVSDVMKCAVVLPISLYVLMIQNWMLGELLCSFLPMLQDIPLHTSTLTFALLAWDRFQQVRNPAKPRLPAFVCTIGTWLTSVCLVLPYPIYIIYIDLGKYSRLSTFDGVGVCTVNLADDMKEYMRGIFLVMYAAPLAIISYLCVRISRELKQQSPAAVITFEARGKESRSRTDSHSTTTEFRRDCDLGSEHSRNSYRERENVRTRYENQEPDFNVMKEKRTQKYFVSMVTMYAICLCPLMILRLARLALVETYDNSGQFDLTYTVFVWVAFVPTCSTPLLFAAWQMNRSSKERLRGYFRVSNRKLRQSCETVITAAGTPAASRPTCNHRDVVAQQLDDGTSDSNSCQQDFNSS